MTLSCFAFISVSMVNWPASGPISRPASRFIRVLKVSKVIKKWEVNLDYILTFTWPSNWPKDLLRSAENIVLVARIAGPLIKL